MGSCRCFKGKQLYAKCHTDHPTYGKHFECKCRNSPVPTGSKFQNVQFASIVQSDSRDVSEGFDDSTVLIIDDTRSPGLDPVTVSYFALATSHSLRGIDLLDTTPGLRFLKTQNSLLLVFVAFNCIFTPKQIREPPQCDDL